ELLVLAGGLIPRMALRTRVVGREERSNDELAWLDRPDGASDFLDDAAVLVPHRRRFGSRIDTAVGPQVGPTDARGRHLDDGICRLDDCGHGALLEAHIARTVENSSSHGVSPVSRRRAA